MRKKLININTKAGQILPDLLSMNYYDLHIACQENFIIKDKC